jgi:hypothetical protein
MWRRAAEGHAVLPPVWGREAGFYRRGKPNPPASEGSTAKGFGGTRTEKSGDCPHPAGFAGLKMPVASVFQIVNREYPDLIRTEQDFETLRHEKPESGVVGRGLRLGFTQFADRISNPPKRSLKANVILWGSIIVITVIAVIIMLHVMSLMSLQDSDPSQ